ncbi:uncharacterized protein LOC105685256 isoform X2 [Athalia rosae]|uniref:uncharacterized protein LOC105685256 isoform X2 n=1 Tax=Athalia rosae TaxID=37344 RepID=UPI000DE7FAEC|nr:uncharacterized protein LOC105685256 isoform X2 [Athalia rosae]
MRHQREETSRISSRGKGSVYGKGGRGGTLSNRPSISRTISSIQINFSSPTIGGTIIPAWCSSFIEGKSGRQAACMIIEDHPPVPTRPRQNPHQDTTQRFLNHLVLPKHRTSKFSSNRHRKLQPFRET